MRQADHGRCTEDYGPTPYVVNISCVTEQNKCFRRTLWTGKYLQMTLMCIPPCGEIGLEVHPDDDQLLRIEGGFGNVCMGDQRDCLSTQCPVRAGEAIFIPAGT